MKALTVRQPWAWAIAEAGKDVENRRQIWHHRGLLAIHAGQAWGDGWGGLRSAAQLRAVLPPGHRTPDDPRFVFGAIVAVADLVDAHHWRRGCCTSAWRESGDVTHLVLANVQRLPMPLPCPGKQGLWNVSPQAERAVKALLPDRVMTQEGTR